MSHDGIVYGAMIGLGFSHWKAFSSGWRVGVAFARMFTAVPMHASFAVLMGYQVGLPNSSTSVRTNGLKVVFGSLLSRSL